MFIPQNDKDELDRLLANMNEHEIDNLLNVIDIYVTVRSLDEIQKRISTEDVFNPVFEQKMRWIMELRLFFSELLKNPEVK